MAVSASCELTPQRVILVIGWQYFAINDQLK